MKKLFAILLSVVLVLSMSVTAFAAESPATNNGGDTTIDVTGTFVGASGAGEVISVDVSWDAMNFTYTEGAKGEWLPGEHKYAEDAAGSWSSDTATVKVTNHSNTAVKASLSFASSVEGVVGTFDKTSLSLATAEGTEISAAPSASAEFGISGAAIDESKALGVITVAISTPVVVTSEEELNAALASGKDVVLGNDIVLNASVTVSNDTCMDLAGYALKSGDDEYARNTIIVNNGVVFSLKNGTVSGERVFRNHGETFVENCVLYGTARNEEGISTLTDCTISDYVYVYSGVMNLLSRITWANGTSDSIAGYSGSVVCAFDPTGLTSAPITQTGDTWTVSFIDFEW